MIRLRRWAAIGVLAAGLAGLAGCVTPPDPIERFRTLEGVVAQANMRTVRLSTQPPLVAAIPRVPVEVLTVYIEGDGFAWRTREWPSSDPTPIDPVGLRLAAAHPFGHAAWVGRPCQYVDAVRLACPVSFWTTDRFSRRSHDVISAGIDLIKEMTGAKQVVLAGFSGGGAIAANLAALRDDVVALITVAGNLDPDAWADLHGIARFDHAVNPALQGVTLRRLPQVHFVGMRDTVIPRRIAESYLANTAIERDSLIIVDQAHQCCWADAWRALLLHRGAALPWTSSVSKD